MVRKVNLFYLHLQTAVNKPDDSKLPPSADTPGHDGKKSDAPKAKEGRGRPAANAKSGSTDETVRLHHRTPWQHEMLEMMSCNMKKSSNIHLFKERSLFTFCQTSCDGILLELDALMWLLSIILDCLVRQDNIYTFTSLCRRPTLKC